VDLKQFREIRVNKFLLRTCTAMLLLGSVTAHAADWSVKVEPELLSASAQQSRSDFMVYLSEQADLSAAASAKTRADKGRAVVQALQSAAAHSQPAVLKLMGTRGMPQQTFWIANAISTRGTRADIEALARRSDVKSLHLLKNHQVLAPASPAVAGKADEIGIEPSLTLLHVPEVWALGFRGQGVVVGDHDIGVQWDHPALKAKYRGWDGSTASHDYNWLNAFPADPFCTDTSVPCDSHGHGTHTTGTMVGDDGAGNQVGMAPDARWMACRSLLDPAAGAGTVPTYMTCMQWTIAPYPPGNTAAADPAMAPDVVNNSWGCVEACAPPVLKDTNDAIYAAGIVQVASAGNDGDTCSTIAFPTAVYESSFTVGATNNEDVMADFSSRGPVLSDGSMRIKPNVVAPGVGTLSSWNDGAYNSISGTSMASPHVAGLVALIMSAEPRLIGRVADIRTLIERTAVPIHTTQVCGGTGENDIPNNIFGYGRIDALAAIVARPRFDIAAQVSGETDLRYSVTVTEPAEARIDASNALLTVTLPAGVRFKSAAQQAKADDNDQVRHFERAALAAGESWTVDLELSFEGSGPQDIVAAAEADQVSPISTSTTVGTVTAPPPPPAPAPTDPSRFGGSTLGLGLLLALGASLLLRWRNLPF